VRKLLFASMALIAFGASPAPALAADLPAKAPVYKAAAPYDPWTGCYLGIEGGRARGQSKQIDVDAGDIGTAAYRATIIRPHLNGDLIGGTAGCNYQTSNVVWGIEGDWSWTNFKNQSHLLPPFGPPFVYGTKVDWLATLRGRIGYAMDRALFYVTGGLAFADIKATEPFDAVGAVLGPLPDVSKNRLGWTIGGGVEWRLPDPHWSVKAEYLYVDFGNKTYVFEPNDIDRAVKLHENIVRVGLNYKFDWGK
jgi:outer membrane immunogenic protein